MINDRMAARLGWSVPAITLTISSLIHLVSGNHRAFPFFISESDYPGLERWIFTTGLVATGFILCYVSYRLWVVKLEESRKLFMHASLLCGIWVGGNLVVMSFANMYDYPEWHIITAVNVFHFGIAWGVIAHIAVKNSKPIVKKMRIASVATAFVAFTIMSWAMGKAFKENPEAFDPLDLNAVQSWVDIAAPFEYILAIGLFLTLASFEFDVIENYKEEE